LEQFLIDFVCICVYSAAVKPCANPFKPGIPLLALLSKWGLIFLKMTYGICGWESIFVYAVPLWLFLRAQSPAIRWGHSVVCLWVEESGSFHWKTAVLPKLDRESLGVEKVGALSLFRCPTRGLQFEESRPRSVPLVPLVAGCLRECSPI